MFKTPTTAPKQARRLSTIAAAQVHGSGQQGHDTIHGNGAPQHGSNIHGSSQRLRHGAGQRQHGNG